MYAGMHGVSAICAALLGRVGSGLGQHIDIALYDCMISMHDFAAQSFLLNNEIPKQTGHDLPQSTVYGVFAAKDGNLVIAAQVDDAWIRFAKLIGGESYAADSRLHTSAGRNANRVEILDKVKDWVFAQDSVQVCCELLDKAGVPAAPVQTIDKVMTDPQTIARNMVIEQYHPTAGLVRLPNLPFHMSGCDTTPSSPAPLLGQHNVSIAMELGYSAIQIDCLISAGILYSEPDVSKLDEKCR